MKHPVRRVGIALGSLALALVVFHLVENWHSRHAWTSWKASQMAAGQSFDPATYLPKPIPDEDNFARAPIVAGAIQGQGLTVSWIIPPEFTQRPSSGDYRIGMPADRAAFDKALEGQSLEAFLQPFDDRLAQLAEAAKRPGCRLQKDDTPFDDVPALLGMRAMARVLSTRALARIWAGKSEAALDDLLTGFRVVQHLQKEPHLISQLLRISYVNILMQPVWEGLHSHAWNDAQLARLEAALAPIDLIGSMKLGWQFERIGIEGWAKPVETNPEAYLPPYGSDLGMGGRMVRRINRALIPKGWIYQNLISRDQAFLAQAISVLEPEHHRVRADLQQAAELRSAAQWRTPYNWISRLMLVPFLSQNARMARAQTALDHARVACALERYRLAKRQYPETLDLLAPAFIPQVPRDVISGGPLHYQLQGQSYRLYSVGWNGIDEGGQVEMAEDGSGPKLERGDWVWFAEATGAR